MLALSDNLSQSIDALRQHKLRAVLTTIGLTMGVATLYSLDTASDGKATAAILQTRVRGL